MNNLKSIRTYECRLNVQVSNGHLLGFSLCGDYGGDKDRAGWPMTIIWIEVVVVSKSQDGLRMSQHSQQVNKGIHEERRKEALWLDKQQSLGDGTMCRKLKL